jgi:DNA modification methylase
LIVNQIVHGDCLGVLERIASKKFDLVYLDPPFNTGAEQIARNGAYCDRWPTIESYLDYMRTRVTALHRVLKPHGSILLHCDWRTSHHFRIMLDDVFGASGFVNHLIWRYGLGGSSPRRFSRKHDDILFYAKGPDYYFQPPLVQATSNRMRGQMKKACDVIDIPTINNMALERVGYPTQKPLALLSLLLDACCPEGGSVLDPFCGSGTTAVAAIQSGRRFMAIDQNEAAVHLAQDRCELTLQECSARTKHRASSRSSRSTTIGPRA